MEALQRWVELFGVPLLACVAMAAILGYLGLHVLKREIVFVDIALAQIVAVGTIAAHVLFAAEEDSPLAHASALGLAVVAAAFYAFTRRRVWQISTEAVIGVSYAIAAAAALFLLGVAPGGHVHAQHMLTGSILWATGRTVGVAALAFGAVGLAFYLLRRPFGRLTEDYSGAVEAGMAVARWDFLFYCLIGVVITFAVRIGGVVVVFCLLIIPSSIAILLARSTIARLGIAWGAGIAGSVFGLLFADRLDFSVGPSVALLLGVGLAVVACWRTKHPAIAGAVTVTALLALVIPCVVVPSPGEGPQPTWCTLDPVSEIPGEVNAGPSHPGSGSEGGEESAPPEDLTARFDRAPDAGSRCEVVLGALDEDSPEGPRLLLRFLESDPPVFYRQMAVDRWNERREPALDFDATRGFTSEENRAAAETLRRLVSKE